MLNLLKSPTSSNNCNREIYNCNRNIAISEQKQQARFKKQANQFINSVAVDTNTYSVSAGR